MVEGKATVSHCLAVCCCAYFVNTFRLRVLNGTKNQLTSLPPLNNNQDLNNVRELYLSGNELTNDVLEIAAGYRRLRILYLAYNELTELYDRQVAVSVGYLLELCKMNLERQL